jgi:hypothetical protein
MLQYTERRRRPVSALPKRGRRRHIPLLACRTRTMKTPMPLCLLCLRVGKEQSLPPLLRRRRRKKKRRRWWTRGPMKETVTMRQLVLSVS